MDALFKLLFYNYNYDSLDQQLQRKNVTQQQGCWSRHNAPPMNPLIGATKQYKTIKLTHTLQKQAQTIMNAY